MGTNFYIANKACQTCGTTGQPKHIGKRYGGVHGMGFYIAKDNFKTLDEIYKALDGASLIYDEYGVNHNAQAMKKILSECSISFKGGDFS